MWEAIGSTLILMSISTVVGFIAWIRVNERSRTADRQAETVRLLIDKLGTSQEAMAYLESEYGRKLFDSITTPTSAPANPRHRIVAILCVGAVFCSLGLGLLINNGLYPDGDTLSFAVMVLALGAGFLAAAGISYRLSKAWGLLDSDVGSTSRVPVGLAE